MSKDCDSQNPVKRDGTSQQQRLLQALLPDYVAVDERKIGDLEDFVRQYAREINFYDASNAVDGDWVPFFEKRIDPGQRTEPHYALLLTFLKLFHYAQDDVNQITKKHLEYYYKDVLQLKENEAVPDQVFILFKLARHIEEAHLVEKHTALKAGKDSQGFKVSYQTATDMVVNKAQVSSLKAVFTNKDNTFLALQNHYRIYASPAANSADGQGAAIETEEKSWRTFGSISSTAIDRPQATIGFAFASPVLFLAEGNRDITITLNLAPLAQLAGRLARYNLNNCFKIYFSGEKEWIEPLVEEIGTATLETISPEVERRILDFLNRATSAEAIAGLEPVTGPVLDSPFSGPGDQINDYDIGLTVARNIINRRNSLPANIFTAASQLPGIRGLGADKINDLIYTFSRQPDSVIYVPATNQLIFRKTLTASQKAVVAYNQAVLLDPFQTRWPVVKIVLDTENQTDPYIYAVLKDIIVESAHLQVHVTQVKELLLQNDESVLDPAKPFFPFGSRPVIGSNFYIGSWEMLQKKLTSLDIRITWHGLPKAKNFAEHYRYYLDDADGTSRQNAAFKAYLKLLDKKKWTGFGKHRLFKDSPAAGPIPEHQEIVLTDPALSAVARDIHLPRAAAFDTDTQKGFLKLELADIDFGHKDYGPSYTDRIIKKVAPGGAATPLPNEPYTPTIKEIFLNYTSSESIQLNSLTKTGAEQDYPKRIEQFFHVYPFGVAENHKYTLRALASQSIFLLPQFREEGTLYIGLSAFLPPRNISLLFQVAEGSADPELEKQTIAWSYLSDNQWLPFSNFDVLSDTTSGLLTSGIISFAVPKNATSTHTVLPAGLHWLRATVSSHSAAISDVIDVQAQAVLAIFQNQGNDPDRLKTPLATNTIQKLEEGDSAIEKVSQPYASFGGRIKEQGNEFYTRVSERLRHKNRAITMWDYERLVLQKFPAAYKVKSINHTRFGGTLTGYSEMAPGHVTLLVISNVRNKNAVDPLRPKTSKIVLAQIRQYLQGLHAAGVTLHVQNPIYEEIKVKFNVRFYTGVDQGYFSKELNTAIQKLLSPWAFPGTADVVFGGRIHKSRIIQYVEDLEYVDFVTCFEMYHIVPADPLNNPAKDLDEAIASTAASVLGSANAHSIKVLETDLCECPDNEVQALAGIAPPDDCQTLTEAFARNGIADMTIGEDFVIEQ